MEPVPRRSHHAAAATTGGMISETFKQAIPDRLEPFNHHRFRKGNPNVVYRKKTATKVCEIQICRSLDGFGVVIESLIQSGARINILALTAFSGTFGYSCYQKKGMMSAGIQDIVRMLRWR